MNAVKRHPVRGLFAGLAAGLSVAILLVLSAQIALGTLTPIVVVVVGIALGVLWAMFGPARPRRDRSAAAPAPVPMPPPVVEPVAVVEPADPVEAPPAAADGGASTPGVPGEEPAPEGETLAGWRPTHAAPEDGLVTYAGSDEGGGENGRLAPGLPVQLVERQDQWARIVCSNGWAAWVDANRLVEQPGPAEGD